MKVTLQQVGDAAQFRGTNENGKSLSIHAPLNGEEQVAPGPVETLVLSAAACTCVDVVLILRKMRQDLQDLRVDVDVERIQKDSAKPLKSLHFSYYLRGELNPEKVAKAISLAVEKYCSVLESLDKSIEISYSQEISRS